MSILIVLSKPTLWLTLLTSLAVKVGSGLSEWADMCTEMKQEFVPLQAEAL